jgi:septum formation protein
MAILSAAGVAFDAVPADLDEESVMVRMAGSPLHDIASTLALQKALSVSQDLPDDLVLGCDSVVSVNGRIFSKPESRAEAENHLQAFSGQEMLLVSAAALVGCGQAEQTIVDEAILSVRTLPETFIEAYLDAEWPAIAGCVGCFRMEGPGVHLFERVVGNHFTIVGMPLIGILAALRANGHEPFARSADA